MYGIERDRIVYFRIRKKAVVACLKILSRHSPRTTVENNKQPPSGQPASEPIIEPVIS
jgi:hypothetical protein